MNKICIVSFLVLLFFQFSFAQKKGVSEPTKAQTNKSGEKPSKLNDDVLRTTIKTQAEELGRALVMGDFGKLYDLTHPKIRAFIGSRDKFVANLQSQTKENEAAGFKPIAMEAEEPKEILRIGNQLFAVVSSKLRIQSLEGVFVQDASDIAASSDNGKTWKFIGGRINKEKLRAVFPEVAEKLEIPLEKQPYPYQAPKN